MCRHAAREQAITDMDKGAPGNGETIPLQSVGEAGLSLLAEDIPLPVAIIKDRALRHNSAWMRKFIESRNVSIAPHGKTTMAPDIFALQEADGAWGITVSTPHQIRVARHFGHNRIFVANQIVGRAAIDYVFRALSEDADLQIYCIVDSVENARELSRRGEAVNAGRPLNVLVEIGLPGLRTGCRTTEQAMAVAREISRLPHLALVGVEGFEGLVMGLPKDDRIRVANDLLRRMVETAETCSREGLFASSEILLTAGGTAFFDLVADGLSSARTREPVSVLLRSGCYITHDSIMYEKSQEQFAEREPGVIAELGRMEQALEIWAYVQSRPEPTRVIATLGKRDASYDDMPVPLSHYKPGSTDKPAALGEGYIVRGLNDQHAYLDVPADSPLAVGDMIGFGISHPCLTFDKWRLLYLVDDDYVVTGAIRTYF